MAETKPTASASVKSTSVQAKKSSNAISWLAPVICIIAGYCIWRFLMGDPSGFTTPAKTGWFWPEHHGPKNAFNRIYEGGIIVPLLIGMFLMVITFSIERFLTIRKALGNGSIADFIRRVQYHLANRNVDAALSECDKQRGSVANVMKAGLRRYKEMINNFKKKWKKQQRSNCRCFKKISYSFQPSHRLVPSSPCLER
jgi:biopolymer transport protein ExbB